MGAGDVIAQTALEDNNLSTVDYWRTAKFFGIGFCVAVSCNKTLTLKVFPRINQHAEVNP